MEDELDPEVLERYIDVMMRIHGFATRIHLDGRALALAQAAYTLQCLLEKERDGSP